MSKIQKRDDFRLSHVKIYMERWKHQAKQFKLHARNRVLLYFLFLKCEIYVLKCMKKPMSRKNYRQIRSYVPKYEDSMTPEEKEELVTYISKYNYSYRIRIETIKWMQNLTLFYALYLY